MTAPKTNVPLFRLRAGRALLLGVFAMAAVAWIVTLPGIAAALVVGVPLAVMTPRFADLRTPLITTVAGTFGAALAGSVTLGAGAPLLRLMAGVVAGAAAAPWCVVLAFVLWTRARTPGGTS